MPVTAAVILLAALSTPLSCTGSETGGATAESFDIEKRYERGPVAVEIKIDRKEITVADRVELLIRATAREDCEVELPKFGQKLEEFGIVDYDSPPARLGDDGQVLRERSYVLEPFLSGDYNIPPMTVAFWKKDEAEPEKHEIKTEQLTVKVNSLLPETVAELQIRDIAGPLDLPRPPRTWLYATIAGTLLLAVGAAGLLVWVRRRPGAERAAARIPAHELAYRQLEKLLAEKLIEKGQVEPFYTRISDILRHYIENRFGLHAPERTTQEFLDELRADSALAGRHKRLLEEFLSHCDLVKFARFQPPDAEIQKTFDACREFVSQTESQEVTVPAAWAA